METLVKTLAPRVVCSVCLRRPVPRVRVQPVPVSFNA